MRLGARARRRSRASLTPADRGMRFGGLTWQGGQLLAIRETHDGVGGAATGHRARSPLRRLWDVDRRSSTESDFLAQPALSPGGSHCSRGSRGITRTCRGIAPSCASGGSRTGSSSEWTTVAGGDDTSPLQPVWIGEDDLLYADDPTGRWNLWRVRLSADLDRRPGRSRRRRHRRSALGARHALVRAAGRRPRRRRAHERRRRGRR